MANFSATAGIDTLVGTIGDDTFDFAAGSFQLGDSFDGGDGLDALRLVGSVSPLTQVTWNFSNASLVGFEALTFATTGGIALSDGVVEALFNASQFGPGGISTTLAITGSSESSDLITVVVGPGESFSAENWTFLNWDEFDLINGTFAGSDSLFFFGTDGVQTIVGSRFGERILGGRGDDVLFGGAGNDVLYGDFTIDRIGNEGNDLLFGGDGDDFMRGGMGIDTYDGGEGHDRVSFFGRGATMGVVANLFTQTISNDGYGNVETMTSVEGLGAGTAFVDHFTGDDGANTLFAGDGDLVFGNGGDDLVLLMGAPGVVDGGQGVDTLLLNDSKNVPDANGDGIEDLVRPTLGVNINLSLGLIIQDGYGGSAQLSGFENLTGFSLNDTLTGDDAANSLSGDLGNDTLTGGAGDDRLDGGGGVDLMSGGAGNDTYFVDSTGDSVFELGGNGIDLVNSLVSRTLEAEVENLTLLGVANINAFGNNLANQLTGNIGDNTLDGLGGTDVMAGGLGNDTYFVDTAGDNVLEEVGAGIDLIVSTVRRTLEPNVENLFLLGLNNVDGTGNALDNFMQGNAGNNVLSGRGGDDFIFGEGGSDRLVGGDGNDFLDGGIGNDTLIGGAGANRFTGGPGRDTFVIRAGNLDKILDFQSSADVGRNQNDRIDVSGIDANFNIGGDQSFRWVGLVTAGTESPGRLGYHFEIIEGVQHTIVEGNISRREDVGRDLSLPQTIDFHIDLIGIHFLIASDIVL